MTTRQRFKAIMDFQKPDRLPMIEWATWWDKTINRWREEGLSQEVKTCQDIMEYFGLDIHKQFWVRAHKGNTPSITNNGAKALDELMERDFRKLLPYLFPDDWVRWNRDEIKYWAKRQEENGDLVWLTFEGYFWFPRTIFGIQDHLYAFYDAPELMLSMRRYQLEFQYKILAAFCEICTPDFITIAEDMSYNHGPMISKELFDEFIAPCYRRFMGWARQRNIPVIIDTDGQVGPLVPWFESLGVTAILPLERQSGVDTQELRKSHPALRMIGGFDKTIMHQGEAAMRKEFERLLPTMRQGGFIPSVDHQTPPDVSLDNYKIYIALLREYSSITG